MASPSYGTNAQVVEPRFSSLRSRRDSNPNLEPAATCPRWGQFVSEIFPDEGVRRFVWKAAGYSLTGHTTEHHFMFLHGRGANSKREASCSSPSPLDQSGGTTPRHHSEFLMPPSAKHGDVLSKPHGGNARNRTTLPQ
jgi:hypothetical protein